MTLLRIALTRLALLVALAFASPALAQDAPSPAVQPRVTAELTPETAVVGQPLVLRIKVLVPTWLPKPPVFPSLDAPNVIVRLPERASGPVSERVDGETWSGVSRAYRIYPMLPGDVTMPAQEITITYADPDTVQPVTYTAQLDPIRFTATVPSGAEGLDPLVIAEKVMLEQEIDAPDGVMAQGDAASRKVTATITGTSPLFLPELISAIDGEAARAYPSDPATQESEDRGTLSGSRTESVSYVAQYGGSVDLPAITLDWFNISSGQVETAQLEGITLTVDAPAPAKEPAITPRQVAVLIGALILVWLAVWGFRKYLLPPLKRLVVQRKASWEGSEPFAAWRVRRAIGNHDLAATHSALQVWSDRCPGTAAPELDAALAGIGAESYRGAGGQGGTWAVVSAVFQAERDRRLAAIRSSGSALPPLNP